VCFFLAFSAPRSAVLFDVGSIALCRILCNSECVSHLASVLLDVGSIALCRILCNSECVSHLASVLLDVGSIALCRILCNSECVSHLCQNLVSDDHYLGHLFRFVLGSISHSCTLARSRLSAYSHGKQGFDADTLTKRLSRFILSLRHPGPRLHCS
jgi:hypothetical protein